MTMTPEHLLPNTGDHTRSDTMIYGWDDDIEREAAMDGHDDRIDEDDGCDTALPPELLWVPDPEDDERPGDYFMSFDGMAEAAMVKGAAEHMSMSDIDAMLRQQGGLA